MRLRLAAAIPVVVATIAVVGASRAGDPVKSGLGIGDICVPFDVDDVTGPNKGTTLCYR